MEYTGKPRGRTAFSLNLKEELWAFPLDEVKIDKSSSRGKCAKSLGSAKFGLGDNDASFSELLRDRSRESDQT